jgi:hypothetical protein
MKTSIIIIISTLLLIISLFGVIEVYSLPTEIEVAEDVTLVDYEHQGKFDYTVYLKPSYLYGPEPEKPPQSPPEVMKYPAGIIDHINLAFSYRLVPDKSVERTAAEVEVKAIVRSPGASDEQEVILAPRTSRVGDFIIQFPLIFSDNVTDGYITISDNITCNEVIITASVYTTIETDTGPVFESFSQSLPIRVKGPLIEVEVDLDYTTSGYIGELNYEQHGEFNYEVCLKSNSPFGSITLKPPPETMPAPVPLKTIKTPPVIISRLVDGMDMSFFYHLESSQPINKLNETVTIEAILENPQKWSKTIEIVPLTAKSSDFTIGFPLDLKQLEELFNTIQQETGVAVSGRNLILKAIVHTLAETDYGTIDADFIQTFSADLGENALVWSGNMTKSQPGVIKTTRFVPQTEEFLGLPVSHIRTALIIIAVIIFIFFVFSLLWYYWYHEEELTAMEKKARKAQKKYKNIIIEARELPEFRPGETVIQLDSLEDLIRTAEGLFKPVLHKTEGRRHIYYVFDTGVRYEHHLD